MNPIMLGAAECAGNCPPHALAALAGVAVVAFAAGVFVGRRAKKAPAAKGARSQQPVARRTPLRPPEPRQVLPASVVEIYVGNLSYDLTDDALRKEFEAFGKVDSARIVSNRYNNKSKGYGFVVMPDRAEAEKAIAALNEKEFMGRRMRVNEAQNSLKADA